MRRSHFSQAKAKKQLPARLLEHNRKQYASHKQAKRKRPLRSEQCFKRLAALERAKDRREPLEEFKNIRGEALAEVSASSRPLP